GKLDRKALPAPEQATHDESFVTPRTETEARLAAIWTGLLPVERVGVHDNFFQIGGDSIISIQVVTRARQQGIHLEVKHIFQAPTIAGLAALAQLTDARTTDAAQEILTGEVPLTPIQRHFFAQRLAEPNHYNQALMLEASQPLDVAALERALDALLAHHDALRLRFSHNNGAWTQRYIDLDKTRTHTPLTVIDLAALPGEPHAALDLAATEIQSQLDIEAGPIFKAALFTLGDQPPYLLLAAHHLAVDAVSWSILIEDLSTAYAQTQSDATIQLPPKTHAYRDWANALQAYAQSSALLAERDRWQALLADADPTLPIDHAAGSNTEAEADTISVTLSRETTQRLLQQVPQAYRTRTPEVLLTALLQTLTPWTGRKDLLIALEGHGRSQVIERVDTSRTVGWFTALYPAQLRLAGDSAQSLKAIKEQLRTIANDGIGYGLLRYLSDEQLAHAAPQISFNYLGQRASQPRQDALLCFTDAPTGASIGGANGREYRLELTSEILDGSLRVAWSYSRRQYERATIERLAQDYIAALEALIEHCSRPDSFGYTPADFPLARLDQAQIDALFGQLRGVQDVYPLAPMQTGFLFAALAQPDSTAYFTQMLIELGGHIDHAAMQAAWQYVTDHHAILRSGFAWENVATPLQYVLEHVTLPWQTHDLGDLPTDQQQRRLDELLRTDREQGFDLEQPPLQRLALIQLDGQRQLLVWSHHHILLDGWSLPLVIRDALRVYDQISRGAPPFLAPTRPYRDFIAWLDRYDQQAAEHFWRDQLAGVGDPTRLASGEFEQQRASGGDREYRAQYLDFSAEQVEAFKQIAQRHHLTTNTVLQGAWSVLLSRYTRRDDIVFGVPVSGRPADLPGVEEIVGVFINTLPLRVTMSPDDDVLTMLRGIQEQTGRLHDFAYNSLAKVQSWSDVPRGSALFDTLFVFENYPAARESEASSAYHVADVRTVEKTEYPLTITVMTKDQMRAELSYNPDYFDDLAVQRLAAQFNRVLVAITDSLLGSEEQ
ncbi:MAG: non-ribosomal peptide synthetase, partial [Chloroflexi bacterium]|nr:non-ribosomal peptide synthetase [Chloroflexota bacterium]